MARILVTGSAGFIGRYILTHLCREHQVWGLVRSPVDDHSYGGAVQWIVHDLAAADFPLSMPESIDAVVHLAQSRHYRDFPDHADDVVAINIQASARLLAWARRAGAKRFLYVSSGGVTGPSDAPITEDQKFAASGPLQFYLTTKYAAELLVQAFEPFFIPMILRPFFVYGEGQRVDSLIRRLMERIATGEPITLQGTDGIQINPIHVLDVVEAMENMLGLEQAAVVNIAGPDIMSIREISSLIGKSLGIDPLFEILNEGSGQHMVANISQMKRLLGPPMVSFEKAIGDICAEIHD